MPDTYLCHLGEASAGDRPAPSAASSSDANLVILLLPLHFPCPLLNAHIGLKVESMPEK